jgi:hypothetical protein
MIVTTVIGAASPGQVRASRAERSGRFKGRQGNRTKSSSLDVKERRATLATEYEDDEMAC